MSYLLDTNIVSELRRQTCNPGVREWIRSVDDGDLYISVMVLGEIRLGVERLLRRDPARARVYEEWLGRLERDYSDHILDVTAGIADVWGRLNSPDKIPVVDGLIAATAIVQGLTLVTRNVADYARTGARLLNPFSM